MNLLPEDEKLSLEELRTKGAILEGKISLTKRLIVANTWQCDVGKACVPFLSVRRADFYYEKVEVSKGNSTIIGIPKIKEVKRFSGYEDVSYQYYRSADSNKLIRTEYRAKGVKFLVQTKGVGRSFQTDAIVL